MQRDVTLRAIGRICGDRFCWWDETAQCWQSARVKDAWELFIRVRMILHEQRAEAIAIASDIRYQSLFDGGKEVTILAEVV